MKKIFVLILIVAAFGLLAGCETTTASMGGTEKSSPSKK